MLSHNRRKCRKLTSDHLEQRCLLSASTWIPNDIALILDEPARTIVTADFDLDGDADLLGFWEGVRELNYFENIEGELSRPIDLRPSGFVLTDVTTLEAADVEGDGDLDIVGHSGAGSKFELFWMENTDGRGTFSEPNFIVPFTLRRSHNMFVSDMDQDDDVDIVLQWIDLVNGDSVVTWYQNDGTGQFAEHQLASDVGRIAGDDLDGDGDTDIVLTSLDGRTISWIENLGNGSFSDKQVSYRVAAARSDLFPRAVEIVDIDGDMRKDFIYLFREKIVDETQDHFMVLVRNDLGQSVLREQLSFLFASSIFVFDYDVDGDADVFVQEENVILIENINNQILRLSGPIETVSGSSLIAHKPDLLDFDFDGDLDIFLGASHARDDNFWLENRRKAVGDVNGDGVFSSSDLVAVFQAGQYEDKIDLNSWFDDGDWNGDGEFSSGDLVLAFQIGHFERSATALDH